MTTKWLTFKFPSARSGEIAAAYAAGAISREAAWTIAYYRGVVSAELEESQKDEEVGMMSVGLSPEDAAKLLCEARFSNVSVACFNSSSNVTLSGPKATLDALKETLDARNVFCRALRVKNAYHSPYMVSIATKYERLLADKISSTQTKKTPQVLFFSSVDGARLNSLEVLGKADYWVRNLLSPVRFQDAMTAMMNPQFSKLVTRDQSGPISHFLEVGPHNALQGIVRSNTATNGKASHYCSIIKRKESDAKSFVSAVGWLHCHGFRPDMDALLHEPTGAQPPQLLVDLPPYPFDHSQIYWSESRISRGHRFRKHPRHELLGSPVPDWDPTEACWHNYIRHAENPWM